MGLQRYYNRKVIFKSDPQKSCQNLKNILFPASAGAARHNQGNPRTVAVAKKILSADRVSADKSHQVQNALVFYTSHVCGSVFIHVKRV